MGSEGAAYCPGRHYDSGAVHPLFDPWRDGYDKKRGVRADRCNILHDMQSTVLYGSCDETKPPGHDLSGAPKALFRGMEVRMMTYRSQKSATPRAPRLSYRGRDRGRGGKSPERWTKESVASMHADCMYEPACAPH